MVTRRSSICAIVAVAVCLPVATWTFVVQQQQASRFCSSVPSQQLPRKQQQKQCFHQQQSKALPYRSRVRPVAFSLLAKKAEHDDEEEEDPLESEGWEPEEDVMVEDLDLEDLEDGELDLDDVESSVAGTNEDEYDEDDIDYDDDDDDDDDDDGDEDIEEEGGDEDDEFEDEEDDEEDIDNEEEDYDFENQDGGMTEKPPEGYSKWWEDYGFDSREDFDNHELFPGGVAGMASGYTAPDKDFWDDEVTMVPLMENPDDPEFNTNLKKILASSTKRKAAAKAAQAESDSENTITFDDEDPVNEFDAMDELSELLDQAVPGGPNGSKEEEITLTAADLEDIDVRKEMMESTNMIDDDPYISANRTNIAGTGITDEEMEQLDKSWKSINEITAKEPWNKVSATEYDFDYDAYPKQYHYDMQETAVEIGSASYNVYPWLKYDMGFNVSNLVLAAVKHHPDAPLILQHWYPQLMVCERYQHARDRDFDFTWEDVENADMEELEKYYLGFGYDEIPKKIQSETGMISFDETDEQETKMAAMEKWMLDVYNAEWDRKDFDDENIKDEDNVFSDNFKMPAHPDLPAWEDAQEDIAGWKKEWNEDEDKEEAAHKKNVAYRDSMGQSIDFTNVQEDDFQKNYRGHLVVACGNFDEDLETAERITERMEKEFGNSIYTETKIYKHAMEADNVFEVWLESYEIDLLHSKRRSFMGVDGWDGKAEVDDDQMNYLVKEISKLTSEDARNSFRWSEEHIS